MFLDRPFDYIGSERTSKDVCRDACAIEGFKKRHIPDVPRWVFALGYILGIATALCFNGLGA